MAGKLRPSQLSENHCASGVKPQNGFSPANAAISTPKQPLEQDILNIPFHQGSIALFSATDKGLIRHEMARCKYGLGWQWLNPKNKLALKHKNGELRFSDHQGRHAPKNKALIVGDCQQLAHQLGDRLTQRFRGKYTFKVVAGNNRVDSQWQTHYFLVGWPTRNNAYFMAKTQGGLNPLTRTFKTLIPKEAFIIDPTYQVMGYAADTEKLCQYMAKQPLQDIQATPLKQKGGGSLLSFYGPEQVTQGFPVGFAKDLKPDHPAPHEVGFVYFKKQNPQAPRPAIDLQFKWGYQTQDQKSTIAPGSELHTMLGRLQKAVHAYHRQ